ncbi:MAG: alpha/beta hydrolase [Bacteroidales bacterium]
MKRSFAIWLVILSILLPGMNFLPSLNAQDKNSIIIDNLVFKSKILRSGISYAVYLPPGFPSDEKQYPVLYLFHGYGSQHTTWIANGDLKESVDFFIRNGLLPPLVIVMPDAGTSWNINDCKGKYRWEDMFFMEFIPLIEAQYHTSHNPRYRAIGGLSMGGYGAIVLALKHPDVFHVVLGLSAALRTDEDLLKTDETQWRNNLKPVFSCRTDAPDQRLTTHWQKNNPFLLLDQIPADTLKQLSFYLDCGKDDYFYTSNKLFASLLEKHSIPYETAIFEGTHSWLYWRYALKRALQHLGKIWNQQMPPESAY